VTFVATVILSFLVIGVVVLILSRVRTPRYRLRRENVILLLEMVLDGRAREKDWNVFVGIPIRYDSELEDIRLRCIEIEQRELIGDVTAGRRRHLFTRKGLEELRALLQELRARTRDGLGGDGGSGG
jgi:hypothetical protein